MRLYYAAGVYVGTQADAKRLDKDFTQVEVPVDKDGLMAFLNRAKIAPANAVGAPPAIIAPEPEEDIADLLGEELPPQEPMPPVFTDQRPMSAGNIVSQIDTPGIEQIVEVIAASKGQSLRRLAGAVAVRFAELGK